ncbi:MAG: pilus motility taxis protein HmpF [Cyanobacteriota bacterium]|nr:pilus motility taxis protein HmpF [Cyanobacteriota bacterium]
MLYLAELQKRPGGFGLGGNKTDLKLLACQRGENNWTEVRDETIPADEAAKEFTPGALVLVDLSNNKQVQQIQEAAPKLVKILQNFSRSQEKFKTQWEEIEQWKASLTFQAQELNRREMELQAKEEQLQQLEGELERLEQQRQEASQVVEESGRLRETVERDREEIESARARLQAEIEEFENTKGQASGSASLDEGQSDYIKELLDWLSGAIAPTASLGEGVNTSLEATGSLQGLMGEHWQQLEEKQTAAQQQQEELDGLKNEIDGRWNSWKEAEAALAELRSQLKVQQSLLGSKQDYAASLSSQLKAQEDLSQQLTQLASATGQGADKVNVEALEKMPIEELQQKVDELQRELQKSIGFVNDQEEELALEREEMEELKTQMAAASEYDRLQLEMELNEQQENYKFLNESLVGSQRNLRERQDTMNLHQSVLRRRQGIPLETDPDSIDLSPAISQVDAQIAGLREQVQKLDEEIEQILKEIAGKEEEINSQSSEQEAQKNEIQQLEENLSERKAAVAELWGRVNLYQEMLQPMQDDLDRLRQKLEESVGGMEGAEEIPEQFEQLKQVLEGIIG